MEVFAIIDQNLKAKILYNEEDEYFSLDKYYFGKTLLRETYYDKNGKTEYIRGAYNYRSNYFFNHYKSLLATLGENRIIIINLNVLSLRLPVLKNDSEKLKSILNKWFCYDEDYFTLDNISKTSLKYVINSNLNLVRFFYNYKYFSFFYSNNILSYCNKRLDDIKNPQFIDEINKYKVFVNISSKKWKSSDEYRANIHINTNRINISEIDTYLLNKLPFYKEELLEISSGYTGWTTSLLQSKIKKQYGEENLKDLNNRCISITENILFVFNLTYSEKEYQRFLNSIIENELKIIECNTL